MGTTWSVTNGERGWWCVPHLIYFDGEDGVVKGFDHLRKMKTTKLVNEDFETWKKMVV
jgi:hypothetical protein